MSVRRYTINPTPGGPPVRVPWVVTDWCGCRRLFVAHQSVTSLTLSWLALGFDQNAPDVFSQTFSGAALDDLTINGQPLPDDVMGVDVAIQGPPGARVALVVTTGC